MNVHSQCSHTYYHDKPRCTAFKASGYIRHRYGELSAANFHFVLPYCLFNPYCQVQYQQWNRNRLSLTSQKVTGFFFFCLSGQRRSDDSWGIIQIHVPWCLVFHKWLPCCWTWASAARSRLGANEYYPVTSFARAHNLRDRNTWWKYTALLSPTHYRSRSLGQ